MTEFSDESLAKANAFFEGVSDAYELTMNHYSRYDMTNDHRAMLGMAFASYSIGHARKEFGFFRALILTLRAFWASTRMLKSYGI